MATLPEETFSCLRADLDDRFGPGFSEKSLKHGPLWPAMSLPEAYGSSILHSWLKKNSSSRSKESDQKALDKFLQVNQACENWEVPDCSPLRAGFDLKPEILFGEYKRAIYEFWYRDGYALWDNPFDLLDQAKIGPGANLQARGESFYAKFFSSPLSCTSAGLYEAYRLYIKRFPVWDSAEVIRRSSFGEPSVVLSNRLSFVPKNDEISRCICVEPTLNTYFQLGAAEIMNRRLSERFGISLDRQQFTNRNLARLGSITGGLSTLDLSSASDSISLRMLEWSLPRDFYREITKLRCPAVDIKGRGTVALHMVSTMGNGLTFPLQTMLFACMVVAALRFRGIPVKSIEASEQWGVNGDDIVCPASCTQDVIFLLKSLGFTLNHDKSFVEGPFRESCGSDFFQGSDIRGVYVKTLDSLGSRYAVLNQLHRFSTRSGISFPKTTSLLLSRVKLTLVPCWENADAGIHTPLSVARPYLKRDRDTQGYSYTCWVNRTPKIRFSDEGRVVVPRFAKSLIYNPDGLLMAFVQRSINSGQIGIRSIRDEYRAKRRVTSSFDARPVLFPGHPDWDLDWQRWETVVSSSIRKDS